jgi:hypothetical protein
MLLKIHLSSINFDIRKLRHAFVNNIVMRHPVFFQLATEAVFHPSRIQNTITIFTKINRHPGTDNT